MGGSGTTTISGIIQNGAGGLTVNGTGANTLNLAGAASNTFSGETTVTSGTLGLDMSAGTAIIGDGASSKTVFDVLVNGGTLLWDASNQLDHSVSIDMTSGFMKINGFNETFYDFTNNGGTFTTGNGLNTNTVNVTDPTWLSGTNTISSGTTANFGTLNIDAGTNTVQGDGGQEPTGIGGGVLNVGSNAGLNFEGSGSPTLTINNDTVKVPDR